MSCRRPRPSWSKPPQHPWKLEEIKHGNVISTHSLNDILRNHINNSNNNPPASCRCCVTFGRIDDPAVVDVVAAHESCSRLHARIAFDPNGTPWLRDLGSGNGTFVNEKRLPREACGKEEDDDRTSGGGGGERTGSRGVVLYPGDAIRFGASTRIYVLEGPEEFERGAVKLKRKMKEAAAAAARSETAVTGDNAEAKTPSGANEDACGWGMADDDAVVHAEEDPRARSDDHRFSSDLPPLPTVDSFFYSSEHKIPDALRKLHGQFNTKTRKLQSIQTESGRISQKENMGVELTDGQRGQLAKNQERIASLEKEVANLQGRIEDGMHAAIHGTDRARKRKPKEEERYGEDDDVDDFYDRTASSSKKKRKENTVESEQSLIRKWKSLLDGRARQQRVASRASDRCKSLQEQIDNSPDDDEDAFFLRNDLSLANDNMGKATKSLEGTEKKLAEVEYLLKIVNPKLTWDRNNGLIGTDVIEKREAAEGSTTVHSSTRADNGTEATESDSVAMPPPPPAITASMAMPPPPPVAVAPSSKPTSPEQPPILGSTIPPTRSGGGESDDRLSMPPPDHLQVSTKPQEQKKQRGPMRPPANIQGTLAMLKQVATQPKPAAHSRLGPTGNGAHTHKKTAAGSNPFDPKKDEWNAPLDQDGSGRTALHEKFKGRY